MSTPSDLAREAIALAENWAQNSSKVQVLLIENGLEMSRALLSRDAEVARLREALDDAIRTWAFHDWQGHAHSWHDREDWFERHEVARERRAALREAGSAG